MFERSIGTQDVQQVLAAGKTIEHYLDDRPYPSRLVLTRTSFAFAFGDTYLISSVQIRYVSPYSVSPYSRASRWEPGFERRRRA